MSDIFPYTESKMRRRSKKFLFFIACIIFITSYIASSIIFAYLRDVYLPELFTFVTNILPDDIGCYRHNYSYNINESISRYEPNSIFFYQTSCENTLSLPEACSIEAAANLHVNRKVYVIFITQPNSTDIIIKELLKIGNVRLKRVDITKNYAEINFSNAVFLDIVKKERSLYKITADFLKLRTLYEHGGVVLDSDILLAKSLNSLGMNWVLKDKGGFSLAAMKLADDTLGKSIAGRILLSYKQYATIGYLNAERAMHDGLKIVCNISNNNNITDGTCKGLKIYDRANFEPISYSKRRLYLKPAYELEDHRGYHTWDTAKRRFTGDSLYATLARTYCPRIFSTFMYDLISAYD